MHGSQNPVSVERYVTNFRRSEEKVTRIGHLSLIIMKLKQCVKFSACEGETVLIVRIVPICKRSQYFSGISERSSHFGRFDGGIAVPEGSNPGPYLQLDGGPLG